MSGLKMMLLDRLEAAAAGPQLSVRLGEKLAERLRPTDLVELAAFVKAAVAARSQCNESHVDSGPMIGLRGWDD